MRDDKGVITFKEMAYLRCFWWVLLTALPSFASPDWQWLARRLSGGSTALREASVEGLKQTPHLEQKLLAALQGPDRYLALDTIAALSVRSLLDPLFQTLPKDESGAVALTINTLVTGETRSEIIRRYQEHLEKLHRVRLFPPTVMAILDFLGRTNVSVNGLETLLNSAPPEIRSAVLYYVRLRMKHHGAPDYTGVLAQASRDPSWLIREQTESLLQEFRFTLPKESFFHRVSHYLPWPPPRELPTGSPTEWAVPFEGKEKKACGNRYQHLFKKRVVDIRVVFGYKDARPSRFVGDRYEATLLANYLIAPCPRGWAACGFSQDSVNPERFQKIVQLPDGSFRLVRLWLTHSSAGPDDDENRRDPFQSWRSENARRAFLTGIRQADVVLYNGHSRDGGGPDFSPPRLRDDHHVDYTWYLNNRPGMGGLLARLGNGAPVQLLGLFSCVSTGHFRDVLQERQLGLGLITSPRLLYYADALKNVLGALSALLDSRCQEDFSTLLHSGAAVGSSQLTGFF